MCYHNKLVLTASYEKKRHYLSVRYTQRAPSVAQDLYTACLKNIDRKAQRRTEQIRNFQNRVFGSLVNKTLHCDANNCCVITAAVSINKKEKLKCRYL